ncbi:hypothetical protein SAMN02949497_3516 [Methylomagnum ishizawai]|uniref:Uncharacterized protein n=1 Tax=Methylomagnum ishizawai TaxID=1760988 RepID=A0A1Y6D6G7_9GAMM|nr:hypothetical protein [Methylomagnum ishizawai]SMF96132.1 hypothetical protein SAMN02949497_3516 [Methylomagnum ishizawai]
MKPPKTPLPEEGIALPVPMGSLPPRAPPTPPETPVPAAPPVEIPGTLETRDIPALADPRPAPEGVNALVVTGVRVRAHRSHEHNGVRHPAGAEFVMCPEAAELSAARGDIEILSFNEEVQAP